MDYIDEIRTRLIQETSPSNIDLLIEEKMFSLEEKITSLNIAQIEDHTSADGSRLKNDNELYSGIYKPATANYAALGIPTVPLMPKVAGQPYNFLWTGEFIPNFHIRKVGNDFEIYSTGTGSGLKKEFFDGYKNLFGLITGDENMIFEEVAEFVNNTIADRVYGE